MGDAKRRLEKETEPLEFDCNDIDFSINRVERKGLIHYDADEEKDGRPDLVKLRAFELTAKGVVAAAYPGDRGMDRRTGKIWSVWLDAIDDMSERSAPADLSYTIPRAAIDWLLKHAADEDCRTRHGLASWRESLVEYLQAVSAKKENSCATDGAE